MEMEKMKEIKMTKMTDAEKDKMVTLEGMVRAYFARSIHIHDSTEILMEFFESIKDKDQGQLDWRRIKAELEAYKIRERSYTIYNDIKNFWKEAAAE